jgi:hypothetical protein
VHIAIAKIGMAIAGVIVQPRFDIGRGGCRSVSVNPEELNASEMRGTESGTVYSDGELAAIVKHWCQLLEHVRTTILTLVQNFR